MNEQESRDEQSEIYADWAADAENWKAAQDAWAQYMDELADRVQREGLHESMTQLEKVREREAGGKWLYDLWMDEVLSEGISPHARSLLPGWEKQHEKFRECYRRLWDRISEGFTARTQ